MNAATRGPHAELATPAVERVEVCPVCGSPSRALVRGTAGEPAEGGGLGSRRLFRCERCACRYFDPRPARAGNEGRRARRPAPEQAPPSLLDPRTLPRRAGNDFLASRFGYRLPNCEPFGRYVVGALPRQRRRYERLVRGLPAPLAGARLLDAGAENADFLLRMRELGWAVAAQVPDPAAASAFRELGIEVVQGPLAADAFARPFAAITLDHALGQALDPVALLAACHSLLEPGGTLWLATPNADSLGVRWFGPDWLEPEGAQEACVFGARALGTALERAAFTRYAVAAGAARSEAWHGSEPSRRTRGARARGAFNAGLEQTFRELTAVLKPSLGDELIVTATRS